MGKAGPSGGREKNVHNQNPRARAATRPRWIISMYW